MPRQRSRIMGKVKFYDVVSKKPVYVDITDTKVITRKVKRGRKTRTVRMLTAVGPRGNRVYKILGWEK